MVPSCHPSPPPPLHPTSIPPLASSLLSHASTPCFTPVPAQGAARELHLVPLLSHLLVSPTASQMWAVSWGRGHQLEASPAGRSRRRGARSRAGKPAKKAWPWLSHPAQLLLSGRMGSAPPGSLPSPPPRSWVMCNADFSPRVTASLGWLARSPRSSRPPLAEAAAQGLLLEVSLSCRDPGRGSKAKRKLRTLEGGGGERCTRGFRGMLSYDINQTGKK